MRIMASCMTLDELEGAKIIRYFIDRSGTKETKHFTYQNPFGIHFRYRNQLENYNSFRNVPIYLDRI